MNKLNSAHANDHQTWKTCLKILVSSSRNSDQLKRALQRRGNDDIDPNSSGMSPKLGHNMYLSFTRQKNQLSPQSNPQRKHNCSPATFSVLKDENSTNVREDNKNNKSITGQKMLLTTVHSELLRKNRHTKCPFGYKEKKSRSSCAHLHSTIT